MNIVEALRSAFGAIAGHPLRSALTMLGIVIGVAAVIAMVAVGAGARERVMEQIKSLGSNLMIVIPGTMLQSGARLSTGAANTLTDEDALALVREIPSVQAAAPTIRGGAQVVASAANWSTTILGTTLDFLVAREWDVASGRSFAPEEIDGGAKVALIGETVARNLFGDEVDPIGQGIRVRATPFQVIGVLARKGQSSQGQDQDDIVVVPLRAAKQRVIGSNQANLRSVGAILVKVREGDSMADAEQEIRGLLRQRHRVKDGADDDFSIRNLTEIAATRDASSRALSLLLAAVAGVSLLVGGIGIMNIMLVSVTERTREIGLRLAVGARPRDILVQFLVEATTLSVVGGIIGIGLGAGAGTAIATLAGWPTLIEPVAVVVAVVFSGAVGIFFGFYPAHRAAKLDPIEALRHA